MSGSANSNRGSIHHLNPSQNSYTRLWLRKSKDDFIFKDSNLRPTCGPFRTMINAGDPLSRQNMQCNCPNPLGKYAGGLVGGDSVSNRGCGDTTSPPIANCNPKFVYDSSDYIRIKKMNAQRKGYKKKYI